MVLIKRIYSIYAAIWFIGLFLVFFPFYLLAIWIKPWWRLGGHINYIWARIYFPLIFLPVSIEGLQNLKKIKGPCVFCANHFSYIDIPIMGLLPKPFMFIGKSSVSKVPLFGYMFKGLHIMVNRSSLKSRYETVVRGRKAVSEGKSLMVFPEGGILTKTPPRMVRFKEGAFRIAISKQVPIVPITLPYNFQILPDDETYLPSIHTVKIIIHEPIDTRGLTEKDMPALKEQTFSVIDRTLRLHYPKFFETEEAIH